MTLTENQYFNVFLTLRTKCAIRIPHLINTNTLSNKFDMSSCNVNVSVLISELSSLENDKL